MLKTTADAIAPSVTKLFNSSIRCCRPPSSWKISSVVPIPKVPLANSTANYRPISLLSILSKVLEHHFHSLIMEHAPINFSDDSCCPKKKKESKYTCSAAVAVMKYVLILA